MKIYADENTEFAVIEGLRRRKINVIAAVELGYRGKPDEFHLVKAGELEAVILTHDVDFLMMASTPGTKHRGIIFAHAKNVSAGEWAEKDPLYLSAYDFTTQARDFLKTAEPVILLEGRDFLEDIIWRHAVISAKVFRAIGSEDEPEMRFDTANSAAVAMNSLTICIMAFDALAPLSPTLERERKRMSLKALELKPHISSRFNPGS